MYGKLEVRSAVEARNWCRAMFKSTPISSDENDYWWDMFLMAQDAMGADENLWQEGQTSVHDYRKDIRAHEIKMTAEDALIWITQELAGNKAFWTEYYVKMLDQRNQLIAFLYINNVLAQSDEMMFLTCISKYV